VVKSFISQLERMHASMSLGITAQVIQGVRALNVVVANAR